MDSTIFHPQGGGQPNDEGFIRAGDAEFKVEDIKINGSYISHIGTFTNGEHKFDVSQEVEQKVDENARRSFARIHSAGHLLDLAMTRLGFDHLEPGKGYHFPKGAYVEYIGVVEADQRDKLKEDLNTTIKNMIDEIREEDSAVAKVYNYDEAKEILGSVPPYFPEGSNVRIVKL